MKTGDKVLRDLKRASSKAAGEHTTAAAVVTGLQGNVGQAQIRMAEAFARLGALHRDLLSEDSAQAAALDGEVHGRARQMLQRREAQLVEVRQRLEYQVEDRKRASAEAERASSALLGLSDGEVTASRALSGAMQAQPLLAELMVRSQSAKDALAEVEQHHASVVEMNGRKREPFLADPLFAYLHGRRFGTPDYKGWGLVARMDEWVAGAWYARAQETFALLEKLPGFVAEQVETARQNVGLIDRRIEGESGKLPEMTTYVAARAARKDGERELARAESVVGQRQARIDDTEAEILRFERMEDDGAKAIYVDLRRVYEADLFALERAVAGTATREDDELLSTIRVCRSEIDRHNADLVEARKQASKRAEAAKRARDFERDFENSGRATSDYRYSDDSLDGFLVGVLMGTLSSNSAAGQLSTSAREVERYQPSYGTSSSKSDWGGFSSGISIGGGGGGFSSGDSF